METALIRNNAFESFPENPDSSFMGAYKRLSIIHRIQGNIVEQNEMLRRAVAMAGIFIKTKEPEYFREEKYQKDPAKKAELLRKYAEFQINTAL